MQPSAPPVYRSAWRQCGKQSSLPSTRLLRRARKTIWALLLNIIVSQSGPGCAAPRRSAPGPETQQFRARGTPARSGAVSLPAAPERPLSATPAVGPHSSDSESTIPTLRQLQRRLTPAQTVPVSVPVVPDKPRVRTPVVGPLSYSDESRSSALTLRRFRSTT